ncbi:MAG: GAF domain-containing protein [Proteobacteria bacterium]|nr:GAF domain-containing protein [Pseudomonadota bacterium]MBU1387180.1 GAF domain-containing protein [Pseudomonadota bacterium]MBU1541502.1 GAF domain-containing protein [Pseudomonadota bacterium]MBU2430176.1 GAF domain-containing protein [Pseudomonadota bacterium]MBU2482133.1 GAF domain-containing protein [Pseudomonadota bacterium]
MARQPVTVLMLEDNMDDALLLTEMLASSEDIETRVFHAQRLEEALAMAQTCLPDVAILDLHLPDSYGLDTFLSFHSQYPEIPVIIISGTNDLETALCAVQQGAQDYISKGEPSVATIVRSIRYAMERHRLVASLKSTRRTLQNALEQSTIREKEIAGLLKGARAVLGQTDFKTTARKVFDICSELIGSTSGYIALLSEDGSENEVLFLEAGNLPCTVDPALPMPIRGLRENAYRTCSTVFDNDFMHSEWIKFMPQGHVPLKNVLFAPLVIEQKTVGIMGLANKASDFTPNDADIAGGFGELAAIALQNSRNIDDRDKAEEQKTELIQELRRALENVKQLSGLLPICSYCKKIRDDKGYWSQLELYIHEHSEARFSHGICQDCMKKHYPDFDLYDAPE